MSADFHQLIRFSVGFDMETKKQYKGNKKRNVEMC